MVRGLSCSRPLNGRCRHPVVRRSMVLTMMNRVVVVGFLDGFGCCCYNVELQNLLLASTTTTMVGSFVSLGFGCSGGSCTL